jgi:sugar phosphate isomerase/epimerase
MAMHTRTSLHIACFLNANLPELSDYWRELGVHRVSLESGLLEREGIPAVQDALAVAGCGVETITHLFMPGGCHLEPRQASWVEPRERLVRLVGQAQAIGARSIYMLTGGHGSLSWEEAAECFCSAVAPCIPVAEAAGISLLIEDAVPHYAHVHIAHSLRDTVTLAEMAGVGINLDVFSCWTEAGLEETIARAMPICKLVQIGDYVFGDPCLPGRAVPGDGDIPLRRLVGWILEAGYAGNFDIELIGPRIVKQGPLQAARRAIDRVGELLQSLGA